MPEYSIVNVGELSKPATVLIEKISDAVGGIFKPFQIVRVARAEAEAEQIRAESQIQVTDLHYRALHRFLEEEAKKQKNIEQITQQALPQVEEKANPENVEDDWIINFFDKCRLISDTEMQSLWSRILAGEANAPGSYSKRTVNFLSSLDKGDAVLFTKLCIFGWQIGHMVMPLVYDEEADIYKKHGIYWSTLTHLESIGLIQFDDFRGFFQAGLRKKVTLNYYGKETFVEFQNESDNQMQIGHVLLTRIGRELAPICGSSADPEVFKYIREKWQKIGYIKEGQIEKDSEGDN